MLKINCAKNKLFYLFQQKHVSANNKKHCSCCWGWQSYTDKMSEIFASVWSQRTEIGYTIGSQPDASPSL